MESIKLQTVRFSAETVPTGPSKPKTEIITQSPIIRELVERSRLYAASTATVLITGETGTGKEVFARLTHEHSNRLNHRFGKTNCAALSETLMESELFGHEKGAFTGAIDNRKGWFEFAHKGTLLLDEISEIPVKLQAKLLRVLEEREFQRVGSNITRECDVRIIATSNMELDQAVREKRFRSDLYHRLNVLRLHLPPLRERSKDIPLLANHFVKSFRFENKVQLNGFTASAMEKLCSYTWPGNIRQLRNIVHCACVVAKGPQIIPDDLPEWDSADESIPAWLLDKSLEEVEKQMILALLRKFNGSRTPVADQLGITTRTLTNKLKAYRVGGWIEPEWLSKAG